jgi:hypothetical protein
MYGKHRADAEAERDQMAYTQGQQSVMAAPPPAAPAAPSAGVSDSDVARLQELGKLHEQGILTDEEFSRQKALILGG